MSDDVRDLVRPIKRLVEVYACPECHMAKVVGSATERYEAAQRCCTPRECPTCHQGIPKRGFCHPCSTAKRETEEQARWDAAPRVDAHTLERYAIQADDDFYADLEEFLDCCAAYAVSPADRHPWIASWKTAHVPHLIDCIYDEIPEEADVGEDLRELEAYLAAEFEKRKIGAYFAVDQVPILPWTCPNCCATEDACYCADDAELKYAD